MQPDDLAWGLKLTQAENWSHRLEDWQFHSHLGCGWVACAEDGAPIGTATWWAYGEAFGCVGLVIVDRRQQGQGIGRQLMNQVIDDAGPRTLQLVATRAGLKLYRDCGFRDVGGIEQRQGVATSHARGLPRDPRLRAVTRQDLSALVDFDASSLGAPRPAVIRSVLETGSGGVLAEQDGRVTGFALKRPSGRGTVIGPLVASDEPLAIALTDNLLKDQQGFTRIDIPSDARQLAAWLDAAGLVRVDEVMRMMRGAPPDPLPGARTFGLVSQALG